MDEAIEACGRSVKAIAPGLAGQSREIFLELTMPGE
jgi:hypothetical protein